MEKRRGLDRNVVVAFIGGIAVLVVALVALFSAMVAASARGVSFSASLRRVGAEIAATVALEHGGYELGDVRLTEARLADVLTTTSLPIFLGELGRREKTILLRFPAGSLAPGAQKPLELKAQWTSLFGNGASSKTLSVVIP